MQGLSFFIPLKPPSVNHLYRVIGRGKRALTAEAKAFQEAVAVIGKPSARRVGWIDPPFYHVLIDLHQVENTTDADNVLKVCLDALQKAGLVRNDKLITTVAVVKFVGAKDGVMFTILPDNGATKRGFKA